MIPNALTIDLEDWYHAPISTCRRTENWDTYESRVIRNTDKLLDLFSKNGVKATFFVLGYIANQYPQLIKDISDLGHEVALHSYRHQRIHTLKPEEFRDDLVRGLDAVQTASGSKVLGFRAPMFSINSSCLWALDVLCEMDFRYDSSVFPIRNGYYGIPNAPRFPFHPFENRSFAEFPLATARFLGINWPIGGGLYVRSIPYSIIRAGIRKINLTQKPAVLYFHPWELDVEQNFTSLTVREKFTHYHGRVSLESKLRKMLSEFSFVPLKDLLDQPIFDRWVN